MDEVKLAGTILMEIPVIRFSRVEIARNKRARADRSNAVRVRNSRKKKK